jgi:hypothetical protein
MGVKYLVLYHDEKSVYYASTDGASSYIDMTRDESRIWSEFPRIVFTNGSVTIRANIQVDERSYAQSKRSEMPVVTSTRGVDIQVFCRQFFDQVRAGFIIAPGFLDGESSTLPLVRNRDPLESLTRWGPPMQIISTSAGMLKDLGSRMDALVRECIDPRPSL